MGWKERKREQGYRDVLVWLEPTAVEALEQLKAASPGASVADLVSRAVILAVGMELPETAGHVAGGHDPEVASLKDQLALIEARLAVRMHEDAVRRSAPRVERRITAAEQAAMAIRNVSFGDDDA